MDLTMETMKNDVKQLCQIQIVCLQNLPTNIQAVTYENIILEALTGAYIAGITKGINLSKDIEKEFKETANGK